MSENKALWDRAFKTDPKAVKPITGKDYGGNSPKPYWIIERMTEEFGPCGIGWGFSVVNERFERFNDTDTLHVALVRFWYVMGDKRGEFEQMGQTKASYVTSKGVFKVDEDAPKKSVTDALVKCASYLGFAGDIFSGRWDDSKYVAEARQFYEEKAEDAANPVPRARRDELDECALVMLNLAEEGKSLAAARMYYELPNNDEKMYVWGQLKGPGGGSTPESRLRAFIKANSPHKAEDAKPEQAEAH